MNARIGVVNAISSDRAIASSMNLTENQTGNRGDMAVSVRKDARRQAPPASLER